MQLNGQAVQFLIFRFNVSHLFAHSLNISCIWPIDRILSGANTLDQRGPGTNGNEGILCIPQNSRAADSPSDSLMVGEGSYPYAEMQSVYPIAPAKWKEKGINLSFSHSLHCWLMAVECWSESLRWKASEIDMKEKLLKKLIIVSNASLNNKIQDIITTKLNRQVKLRLKKH